MNRSVSVSAACSILGFTRQAYYKPVIVKDDNSSELLLKMIPDVVKARQNCPSKGCRSIYEKNARKWSLGRDKSIALLMESGLGVKYPKKYRKATQAGNREFGNLLFDKQINSINQVWQADMAYYLHGDKRFYTIYITDVYSQEIVGFGAFETNHADNYAEVLLNAIKRQKGSLAGLIHHSDGGKQYESAIYKEICRSYGIDQSMCMYSYENPYAEKTNDLINNGYLTLWKPRTLKELRKQQAKAVKDHNHNSSKQRLGKKSPAQFRQSLANFENARGHWLQLKPVAPEQPRNKQLPLTQRVQ